MTSSSVARRYARALLSLGIEDGRFEAYGEELSRLEAAFQESEALRELWQNPAHEREERLRAVAGLKEPLALSPLVANLLGLLVERQRAADLPLVAQAYRSMVDERVGKVRATVTSARALPPAEAARVEQALGRITGKQVSLETRVDQALVGGVVAQVGSTVFDGSVRTQLDRLRATLRG